MTVRFPGRPHAAAVALGLLSAVALSGGAGAKVLATVNGTPITDGDVAVAKEDLAAGLPAQLEGAARDTYVLDYLIDGTLVAQKAQSDKLDATPDFAKKLAYQREKLLMETLLTKVANDASSDAAIQKAYDEVAKAQKPGARGQGKSHPSRKRSRRQEGARAREGWRGFRQGRDGNVEGPGLQGR